MSTLAVDKILLGWKLRSIGMSTLIVDRIFVALKAMIDSNFNSHSSQDFESSENSTLTVDANTKPKSWPNICRSGSYSWQECQPSLLIGFWYLWRLWSAGLSTPTVDRTLEALKDTVNNKVYFYSWQDFCISESCGCQL